MTRDSESDNNHPSETLTYYVYDWEDGATVTTHRDDLDTARPTRFFVTKRLDTAVGYATDEATKRHTTKPPGNWHAVRAAP